MADKKGNTGYRNTGYRNTGDMNTGNYNNGDSNTGSCNTGYRNTGNMNTGNMNTGSWNTGNMNTGSWNTGNWNTGNYNTGSCNTTTPNVRLFNKETDWKFTGTKYASFLNKIYKYQCNLCRWVYSKDMTLEEKRDHKTHETTGGYLKVLKSKYNEKEVSKEDIDYFESLPNFCPKILEETTGIVLNKTKTIEIDGETIEISLDSFNQLKKSLLK